MSIGEYLNNTNISYVSNNSNNIQEMEPKSKSEEHNSKNRQTKSWLCMASLSSLEKALYAELISKGELDAAQGLLLIGMSRIGRSGQQIRLPNGDIFYPTNLEVKAKNIRSLFKYAISGNDGVGDHIFDILISYLSKQNQ